MKKTHLLSVLALGISAACHAETYPAPVGPSQSDFGGVACCKRRQRVWRVKGR